MEARTNETQHQTGVRQRTNAARHVVAIQQESPAHAAQRRQRDATAHRNLNIRRNAPFLNIARQGVEPAVHYIGEMNSLCPHCGALKFPNENLFKCCHNGKVSLPALKPYPDELKNLLLGNSAEAKNFQKNIRKYNSAFAFASFGAKIAPPGGRGPPCFRICGQIYHRSGNLHPAEGKSASYGQLYIFEAENALDARMSRNENSDCIPEVTQTILDVIVSVNPYAAAYKHMGEVEEDENALALAENRQPSEVSMHMYAGNDERRYNLPNHQEVAAIFVGEDGAPPIHRYIVVYPRGRPLHEISTLSANLDPMTYPLLFPNGEPGWYKPIAHIPLYSVGKTNIVTMLQYFYNFPQFFLGRNFFNSMLLMLMPGWKVIALVSSVIIKKLFVLKVIKV